MMSSMNDFLNISNSSFNTERTSETVLSLAVLMHPKYSEILSFQKVVYLVNKYRLVEIKILPL